MLSRLQRRDAEAQLAVWRAEHLPLRQLATSVLGASSDSEALVSDVFCDFFFRYVDQVRASAAIPAYLRVMVVRRARRQASKAHVCSPIQPDVLVDVSDRVAFDHLDRGQWLEWLERCLGGLTTKSRTVMKLHYGHQQSYSQIGTHLSCAKQAIGKIVLKSLEALRRCLERHQNPPAGTIGLAGEKAG
jgi:RNA polymerase sigma factor (sigma-70 family)